MKKIVLLAAGVATLSLGACSRTLCPAYSSTKAVKCDAAPVMASNATAAERQ